MGMHTRRRRTESGAAAVEFAFIMPILLLLVFAIIQYALYFWAYQGGADAARSAARLAAVNQLVECDDFQAAVATDVSSVSDDAPDVKRHYENAAGTKIDGDDSEIGDFVVVGVTFESADLKIPFLPFVKDGVVESTARARIDFENPDGEKPEECA
jgi:hypothetical protein